MISAHRFFRVVAALLCLGASGCTALREIPRSEYASRPERRNVAVDTQDGLHYEFDFVRLSGDSLVGYRRRDSQTAFEEFDALPIPLESVTKFSSRRVDWYRTGMIGGAAIAAIVTAALARRGSSSTEPDPDPCGKLGCP
jgi:hypothetical protein